MTNQQDSLKQIKPSHKFFVGVDSDGCAFDTMEIKHKECFCPAFIQYMGLQTVSRYAREVWDFVNLYSKSRGLNRFLALIVAVRLLGERPEVKEREIVLPDLTELVKWTKKEGKLGEAALEEYIKTHDDPGLKAALGWSRALNSRIQEMVYGIAPFPKLAPSLEKLSKQADILVVSQTPFDALDREWKEHNIEQWVVKIAGQELGTKAEHLELAAKGKYDDDKILMIGDAPGDYRAAKQNGVLFYPILPGKEEESWERFYEESMDRFLKGSYKGTYEDSLMEAFDNQLPELPSWKL